MKSRELSKRLIEIAAELKRAATWNGSGLAVDATGDPFLYELLCYFHVALKASENYTVRVDGRTGTSKGGKLAALWPKKPGLKRNFSYLRLTPKSNVPQPSFQLCPGIKIEDRHQKQRAPDINLMRGDTPSTPTYTHLLLCWDAKYTGRAGSRLADDAVSDFIFTVWQLGNPVPDPSWLSKVSAPECQKCGLLTNALGSTERDATLQAHNVSETREFPTNPSTRP